MSGESGTGGPGTTESVTIPFGERYAGSENFSAVFREGMALVEETASYLDGEGRRDAKALTPPASLAYATESMRLTTRLMQIASWLLIRRAVNDGEMTTQQAREEKTKVKLKAEQTLPSVEEFQQLPDRLKELIAASLNLNRRIVRLDQLLNVSNGSETEQADHPLGQQFARLHAAFNGNREPDA